MVPQQVSFVERSSLSQRVPYRRFHCILYVSLTDVGKYTVFLNTRKAHDTCSRSLPVANTCYVHSSSTMVRRSLFLVVYRVVGKEKKKLVHVSLELTTLALSAPHSTSTTLYQHHALSTELMTSTHPTMAAERSWTLLGIAALKKLI